MEDSNTTEGQPQVGSDAWFAQLDAGEGMLAWYAHPDSNPQLVMLTGAKYTPGNPHVEWLVSRTAPRELNQHERCIKASDLAGTWGECIPPTDMVSSHWANGNSTTLVAD